jgi:hypothetical protein
MPTRQTVIACCARAAIGHAAAAMRLDFLDRISVSDFGVACPISVP